ncbi:hypothetical protein CK203_013176 [Vitis vinifera]|uniref:WDR11 first beta-propeller domain-containing protein n=1 Tax=Vitis vinifera TaxID=29760 RepID=A0A438JQ96_VITVI|nr:hypothetical protein CK203_013176 [Vitis vinifera]
MARPPHESWDCMLPGPPSRNNGGSADCHPSGLLASPPPAASQSSTPVQCNSSPSSPCLLPTAPPPPTTTPPPPPPHRLSPPSPPRPHRPIRFPPPLRSPLVRVRPASKPGIQDLCWVQGRSDWVLASLSGPSLLSIWNASTGRCIWKYDVSPEFFSCIRRDPFDSRHLCAIGLKGFLLSIKVLGDTEDDVVIKEFHIPNDSSELQKLERDASGTAASSPALAVFPLYIVRFNVTFAAALPRGCGKFLDVLPDPNNELLYCAHLDGRLSTWRRKEGEQVHVMCTMEELMPSIGTPVPSPSILAVVICKSDSTLQCVGNLYSSGSCSSSFDMDFDNPFDFCDESFYVSKTHLISISDDGKIWNWLLTSEGTEDTHKEATNVGKGADVGEGPVSGQIPTILMERQTWLNNQTV